MVRLGGRALWLEHGRIMAQGSAERVVSQHLAALAGKDAQYQAKDVLHHAHRRVATPAEIVDKISNIDHRSGDGQPVLTAFF
jgi:hypothetical protein